MLDLMLESMSASKKDEMVTRLVYVAEVKETVTDKEVVEDFHRDLLARLGLDAEVSGVLLVLTHGFVFHFLELFSRQTLPFLRELRAGLASGPMDAVRVLLCTDDVGGFQWPQWTSQVVNLPEAGESHMDKLSPVVGKCYMNLLKLGKDLNAMSSNERKAAMTDLKTSSGALLPDNEQIEFMAASKDSFPLNEYLALFDSPVDLEMESERVWPVPERLPY